MIESSVPKIVNRSRERERNLNRSGSMNEDEELNKIANVKSSFREINQRPIPSDYRHPRRLSLQLLCTLEDSSKKKWFILARPNFRRFMKVHPRKVRLQWKLNDDVSALGPGPTGVLGLAVQLTAQQVSILGFFL